MAQLIVRPVHDAIIVDTFGCCFSTATVISTSPSPQTIHHTSTPNANANSPGGVIAASTILKSQGVVMVIHDELKSEPCLTIHYTYNE